jgi:hypothetical protein
MINRLKRITMSPSIPGAQVFNGWIDGIVEIIENLMSPTGSGIAKVTATKGRVGIYVPPFPVGLGVTTSTIAARVGAVPGLGNASLYNVTFVSGIVGLFADSSRTNVVVYNFSSTTGGVGPGKFFIWMKLNDFYFIVSAEC